MSTPMTLPACELHGQMALQPPGTPEQAFCGTWYRCTRCTNTTLLASPGLNAQLAAQRSSAASRT